MLLVVIVLAATLRFWQLGFVPPGFYRDEAFNGLDAVDVLTGRRQGQSPFYFESNNGREPAYIYLTAIAIRSLGRSPLAVRLAAAVVGTLTTWLTYLIGASWFDRRVGLLAAAIWAITVWPIHLSRIGLRPILLPALLALTFWLGGLAIRRQRTESRLTGRRKAPWLWLVAGLAYGASYYTYLAVRFTPLLLLGIFILLLLSGRARMILPGAAWFGVGTLVILLPLILLALQQPALILERPGQVSIFNPDTRETTLFAAFGRQSLQALGMFFVRGDPIVRHNPAGRPVFDAFMALPFLAGLAWCVAHRRRLGAAIILLWIGIMLGPTILAEDTPHFLRAVGVLPAVVVLPALGLSWLWTWPRLPRRWGSALVMALLSASLLLTVRDYFMVYVQEPRTAYWFEAAAQELAQRLNGEPNETTILADRRFWDGWPAVRYLLKPDERVTFYRSPSDLQTDAAQTDQLAPVVIYAWPYEDLKAIVGAITPPALVVAETGALAQGDLEPAPYPLFVRYTVTGRPNWPVLAKYDNSIQLHQVEVFERGPRQLEVMLYWSANQRVNRSLVAFVHVVNGDGDGLVGQSDVEPGDGFLPVPWWRPGETIGDRHLVDLREDYDSSRQQILIGLYYADSRERLSLLDSEDRPIGDAWLFEQMGRE